jgi:hypothetical protein
MEIENNIPEFDELDVLEIVPSSEQEQELQIEPETVVEEEDSNAFALFNTLKEKNIIPYEDGEEIKSWSKLEERLAEIPQLITKSIIDESPEHTKKLFQYAFTKGNDLTKEDLKTFINTYLDDVSDKEIETNDEAREVLKKMYASQGMKEKSINAVLDTLEDDDELIEEAKKFKVGNKADKLIQDAEQEVSTRKQADETFIKNIQKDLSETGWQKDRVEKVTKELSSNVINTKLSELAKDSKGLIQLANFLSYYDLKSKNFNFEAFVNQTFSKDAEKLKTSILKDNFNSASTRTQSSTSNPRKFKLEDLVPILDTE